MKRIVGLLLVLLTINIVSIFSEEKEFNNLFPEHQQINWEQVSLDILVHEIESAAAEQGLENFKAQAKDGNISIIYRDILFPPDSPEITVETRSKINRMITVLERFSDKGIRVEGHTAKIPNQEDDGKILSKARAEAVSGVIAESGIFSADRIEAFGRGEYEPIADNDTQEGRIQNRRVEISIVAEKTGNSDKDNSLWWRTLTDIEEPGYSVFLLDNSNTDIETIKSSLKDAGFNKSKVFNTKQGIAVIYSDASYVKDSFVPDDWTKTDIKLLSNTLQINDLSQVRIGGRGVDIDSTSSLGYQYGLGYYIASSTDVLPENTLVGDAPLAFSFEECKNDFFSHEIIDSIDFSITETNPLTRYREFSFMGIGLGSAINFKIPPSFANPDLVPFRISFGAQAYYHFPDMLSSVEDLWEGEWNLGIGYRVPIGKIFVFTPYIAYGGTVHFITFTPEGASAKESTATYSQTLALKADLELAPTDWVINETTGVAVFMQLGYRIFFDAKYTGLSIPLKIGVRFDL